VAEVVFVVNPASGNGAAGKTWARTRELAAARGLNGDALVTEAPGHAVELARGAAESGVRLIVAVGGDGTINEIVNGLVAAAKPQVELAVVPRGTGDDFARTFEIPTDLESALAVAANGHARPVDIGRATYAVDEGTAERYFANFAGAGISGAIARRGARTSRRLGAKAAYMWATAAVFLRWSSVPMRIELDGETREGRMFELVISNGMYAAGGMKIAPEARPDDGQFDVVLIGDVSKADFVTTFPKIYRGTHTSHPKVDVVRASKIAVDASQPLPVVLDGEQPGTTPARFEIVPGAIKLRVPG
jgi:YegS/Rv2252/BmrU family lipid kinase